MLIRQKILAVYEVTFRGNFGPLWMRTFQKKSRIFIRCSALNWFHSLGIKVSKHLRALKQTYLRVIYSRAFIIYRNPRADVLDVMTRHTGRPDHVKREAMPCTTCTKFYTEITKVTFYLVVNGDNNNWRQESLTRLSNA